MTLPRQLAILQHSWEPKWPRGVWLLRDSYELVEIGGREISPPLGIVTWRRGVGLGDGIRCFLRRSYSLELDPWQVYRLVNTSTLVTFRWELRDPCDRLVGTVSSSLFGLGYRIAVESTTGELPRRRFKSWADSVEVLDRCRLPLARIDQLSGPYVAGRGALRYRIELDGIALGDLNLQLLVTAAVLVKSKVETQP